MSGGGSSVVRKVRMRAERRCEAMIRRGRVWERCTAEGTDVHHMLSRSRGGLLLDEARETYHLVCVCREHHRYAHAHPQSPGGLTLPGYVRSGPDGRPVYVGPDEFLKGRYGRVAEEAAGS
jgi:hypothetical protein